MSLIIPGFSDIGMVMGQDRPDQTEGVVQPDTLIPGVKPIIRIPEGPVVQRRSVRPAQLYYIQLPSDITVVQWDSVSTYTLTRSINGIPSGVPQVFSFDQYVEYRREQEERAIRFRLIEEGKREEESGRGLLDFSINVPGGENSAFTTIFGKPEVNLRVNGSANMNVGASIQKVEDPNLPPDLQRRIDPTFNQNLQLNIQGTIGDKLTISTDWDTERQFDFQNRLNIVYQGYEDEIIKRIEMGNVSMETGNSLIQGGGALFGIKSIAELGSLRLTSVVSQQEGQSNTQTVTGGSQEQPISIRPTEYDNDRHFFIDFYNRQEFEGNVADPQQLGQAYQISQLNVWVEQVQSVNTDQDAIEAISLVDLGVVQNPDSSFALPNPANDRFDDALLEANRDNPELSAETFGVSGSEFKVGYYKQLQEGVDYTYNPALGYFSLKRGVDSKSTIAVSFSYVDPSNGSQVQIGDLIPQSSSRSYLKLIRPQNMTTDNRAWPLTMRNIYSLGVSNITPDGLDLNIYFTEQNVPQTNLPGVGTPLLQDLGLDRTNTQGALPPDNIIDFSGITLNAAEGKVMFPYLEPFGARIDELLMEAGASDSVRNALVFRELYDLKINEANQRPQNSYYRIEGASKGGVSGTFFLGGYSGLVEGSVSVFANGVELTQGVDYEVDYSFGNVTILNDKFLAPGQEIRIEYENNQFAIIGQRNFTGLRAEYEVNDDIVIGSTLFRLKEQPTQDKLRIGNAPINNTIIGLDAKARFDTPWLTRAIDKVPLLQTKEASSISVSGEFAQLRPGVAQTKAVQDAIDRGDLFRDEENGLEFIDDFEGTEFNISFSNAIRWNLAPIPAAIPGYIPDEAYFNDPDATVPVNDIQSKRARADLRAQFSWYSIPRNISSILGNAFATPESQTVLLEDVFPGRQTNNPQEEVINTLDIFYNPTKRGPYNLNKDLRNQLELNPDDFWGGMTAVIPSGQEDLTQNNVEFLEFWVQPILPGGQAPTAQDVIDYDGKIYIDIGVVSEDVVPNFRLNSEDGLATNLNDLVPDNPDETRSFIPSIPPPPQGQFSNDNRELEDVGLDGIPTANGFEGKDEVSVFTDFIDSMRVQYGANSPEFEEILQDPSNDDFFFYTDPVVQDLPLQERFYRVLGYHEGNTPVAGGGKQAITLKPDKEGLITPSTIEQNNSYFQYEVDLNPADFANLEIGSPGTYIVDKVPGDQQQDRWHLVRIPLTDFVRKVGDIEDFQNISYIRVWMSGYRKPFTMRFATFEFVGNQWRKALNITDSEGSSAEFRVSTINIEENANRTPIPYRQPEGSIRAVNRGQQLESLANEQSLLLEVDNLGAGEVQLVKKVYPGGLNLLYYSNMRMFVHGEGYNNRGDAELVVRMGTDLNSNYYEYRQPVTPSDPNPDRYGDFDPDNGGRLDEDAELVWLYEENSMNILLAAFNELKQIRDQQTDDNSQLFEMALGEDDDAVPGAVVAVKGNPSLSRITELGMGIRNPYDATDPESPGIPSLNAGMWLNELRVSGFDNQKGWAANAKANFKLADFATINTNFTRQTAGFGSLESNLGQRRLSDQLGYNISSTVNLHKLIPDRFGWNFPVSVSTRRNSVTPQFLPNQGDIRLDDFVNATEDNPNLTDDQKSSIIDSKIREVQTVNENFSLNISNISKTNSRSKLAQYTLDKTRLSYVYNQGNLRNPEYRFQDNWNYTASINYSLTFRNIRLFRPFGFTESVPVLGLLSKLRLGYMPSSISATAGLNRSYDERRRRIQASGTPQPLLQSHTFTQRSSFGLNYQFTESISTSFRSNTNFDLSRAGIEPLNRSGIDSTSFRIKNTFETLGDIVNDSLTARRSNYQETFTATWRPRFNQVRQLNWLSYTASYGGGYSWNNSPEGSNLGANISNNFRLDNSLNMNTNRLLDKVGFISKMSREDQSERQSRQRNKVRADSLRTQNLGKDLKYIGRKIVLALFSLDNINITYKQNKNSSQAGYNGDSQFYYAFNNPGDDNYSPSLAYRLGLVDELGRDQLISNSSGNQTVQLPINKTTTDDILWGTKFTPFRNFTIDLDWQTRWTERNVETISLNPNGQSSSVNSASGEIRSSVWAFGKGYDELFSRHLSAAFDDFNGSNQISDASGNQDGRSLFNRRTLQEDFRKAYLGGGAGSLGKKDFTPFPKPNWRVTWSGLEDVLPVIGDMMNRASLTHAYTGSYRLGWIFNPIIGSQPGQNIGNYSFVDFREEFEPASINVQQSFDPLIQLNITWSSNLSTQLGFNSSKQASLSLSSRNITERISKGINFNINYSFRKVRIPFFPKVRNNIDITINGRISDDSEKRYALGADIESVLSRPDVVPNASLYSPTNDPFESGQKRINGTIIIGYRFSSTISSNFEYTYSNIQPKSSQFPPRTNQDIRFNVRVAIRSR
ncbi:cell surface protein SprA [Balneola sp. MJW-20]|uniref:T9SS outer membrane translocon Sov/SprA n=1 Tax=Gracilimonas aurantiaca TaxID=3234185 RepID=UPI0034662049